MTTPASSAASICIPLAAFKTAPEDVRAWLLETTGLTIPVDMTAAPASSSGFGQAGAGEDLGLARMSDSQVRRFLENLHPKTRGVITAIAELGPQFRFSDLLKKVDVDMEDWRSLSGVWSGLTKRTRSITKDPEADLLAWPNYNVVVDKGDMIGIMDPATHAAFRRALGF